jgi:uncharacterized protein (DUF433 family)
MGGGKLTWEKVEMMRHRYARGETVRVLARNYGVSPEQVRRVLRYVSWK